MGHGVPFFKAITMNTREKLPVKTGLSTLETNMTFNQALRCGKNAMPNDLKRAGFKCTIFRSDKEINGSDFYSINYGKVVGARSSANKGV